MRVTPEAVGSGSAGATANPNEQLVFEISPHAKWWSFTPEFYPDRFNQKKSKELSRNPQQCGGERVSLKAIKNREFHAKGVLLEGEIPVFQKLLDFEGKVDIISPLTPSGGMECYLKAGELGKQKGWDPHTRQWMFKYSLDLVSTGRDEYTRNRNAIVTEIVAGDPRYSGVSDDPSDFNQDDGGSPYQ